LEAAHAVHDHRQPGAGPGHRLRGALLLGDVGLHERESARRERGREALAHPLGLARRDPRHPDPVAGLEKGRHDGLPEPARPARNQHLALAHRSASRLPTVTSTWRSLIAPPPGFPLLRVARTPAWPGAPAWHRDPRAAPPAARPPRAA